MLPPLVSLSLGTMKSNIKQCSISLVTNTVWATQQQDSSDRFFFFHRSSMIAVQLLGKNSCFAFLRRFNLAPLHRRDVHPGNLPASPMPEVRGAFLRQMVGLDWDNLEFQFVVALPWIIAAVLGRAVSYTPLTLPTLSPVVVSGVSGPLTY